MKVKSLCSNDHWCYLGNDYLAGISASTRVLPSKLEFMALAIYCLHFFVSLFVMNFCISCASTFIKNCCCSYSCYCTWIFIELVAISRSHILFFYIIKNIGLVTHFITLKRMMHGSALLNFCWSTNSVACGCYIFSARYCKSSHCGPFEANTLKPGFH